MKKNIQTNLLKMKIKNQYMYLVITLFISVITLAQNKLDLEIPQVYRNSTSIDTTSIATIKWKTFFKETELIELIDEALKKNNDLLIAEKNIAIANLQYKQSKWGNVPQVNAFVNASSNRLSENSLNGISTNLFLGQNHVEDFSSGLNLSWELGIWGKVKNQKKRALAEYLQTSEAKKALQTTVVANVAKNYYNLLMLDAQLEIAKKTLVLNDSISYFVNLQYESGLTSLLAKEQTDAQRLVAAKLIPQIEQNIQIQENSLSVLTGSFPSEKIRNEKLNAILVHANSSIGIPSQLLERRPDVKNAELALQAANAKIGIAKSNFYPTLNITASSGVNSFEADNWFTMPASLFANLAGSLTAPILNGRKIRTQYEITKQEREQAVDQFRQTVLVAVSEVSNALVGINKLEEQFNIADERKVKLQSAVNNSNLLFKNGMATYLELIIAQSNLLQAELELTNIKKDLLSANVELYRALGGGWN
jgi:NodT family efflux transporter outer membrane factor (OMF) lipoprotein